MLFNSLDFAIFLPIVFYIFWAIPDDKVTLKNFVLLAASYVFYGWWDVTFLGLIFFSSIVDFAAGRLLHSSKKNPFRKLVTAFSLSMNLGLLCYFKYFNFFLESFSNAYSLFGIDISMRSLSIILPVGISFYTFQTMSYTIDVYRRKIEPTSNIVTFLCYVSFFPQLVAGPIERAKNLLPQFEKKVTFDYQEAVLGIRQILWGLFKKIVIADNCAVYANLFFNDYSDHTGSSLLLGVFFFTFQIYGDFSGYSDIAIGTARLFGYKLMTNFKFPYFSRDIAEFWRRWHISLSTWFRDYLYFPLGGSRGSMVLTVRNVFIIFIVSGFWHGANWTFLFWGFLNALFIVPLVIFGLNRNNINVVAYNKVLPSIKELVQMVLTFSLTMLAWTFFRAPSITDAINILSEIFSLSLFSRPLITASLIRTMILVFLFVIIEWLGRRDDFAIEKSLNTHSFAIKALSFAGFITFICVFMQTKETPFIYFQF